MPSNKKESFVFTLLMCSLMVLCMSFYNVARIHGFTNHFLKDVFIGFPLGFVVAFAADWFFVGPIAKKVAYSFVKEDDPIIKIVLVVSSSMVIGMVIFMSGFGAIMGGGLSANTPMIWLSNIPWNFIVAFPLQILVVGPVVRFAFGKIFPKPMMG